MREKIFKWIARTTYKRFITVFIICLGLTVIFGFLAARIRIETTWRSMLPTGHDSVKNFEKVLDEFGTATQIIVAIDGPDKETVVRAAHELAPLLKDVPLSGMEAPAAENGSATEIKYVVKRIEFQYDTAFVAQHGFMLEKAKNLEKEAVLFTDYNLVPYMEHINDVLESQYVQDTDNLTKQEKEAVRGLDGMYQFLDVMHDFAKGKTSDAESVQKAVDAMTIGDGYYLSTDKKMLLMFITPTMTVDEIEPSVTGVNNLEAVIQQYNQQHPEIHIGMTGMHVVMRDEMESGMEDTFRNLIVALIVILFVFVVSFRMLSGPLLAMVILLAGIIWDIGLAYIFIGRLNIMTAMCAVILLGLGVDYAIHIISAYTEFRHKGKSIEESLYETFTRVGAGLVTGAATTAVAFLSLIFTSYPAFREFGFVVGAGILCCLLASMFFLPSLLVIKEKIWGAVYKGSQPKQVDLEFKLLGNITKKIVSHPKTTIFSAVILTLLFTLVLVNSFSKTSFSSFIPKVQMNKNYMDMEPEGLESVRLQREIPKRFNMSPDNMLAMMNSIEEADRLTDLLNERPTVGFVESIADYLPAQEKQKRRIPHIQKIAAAQQNIPSSRLIDKDALIEQLYRFNDNLIEMSSLAFIGGLDKVFDKTNFYLGWNEEGDQVGINRVMEFIKTIETEPEAVTHLQVFQRAFIPNMTRRVQSMANPTPITLEMIPESIKERFVSKSGEHFLIYIYSKKDIWDGLFTSPLLNTVIRDVPGVTGSPVFMKAMIEIAKEEGRFAFILAFIAFLIILLIDFRSIKISLFALFPLCIALVWMVGIMGLTGFKFSIVNVMGLPLILGIGIDDGVHIIHRYLVEGRDKLPYAISSIGKAITLTTITTMLGFGSLIPSAYRGYASLGILVTLGIGLCFFTSIFILPAFLNRFVKTR